jgi:hypothetical protein
MSCLGLGGVGEFGCVVKGGERGSKRMCLLTF